jgi:uncharacterized protein (DUF2141 family)
MRSNQLLALAIALAFVPSLGGCSAAREVEIKGTVSTEQLQGTIFVEVYDVRDGQLERVDDLTMTEPGVFKTNVALEGEQVLVRAIDDVDGDEACTNGEQWWEVTATIEHGEIPPLGFPLTVAPCPE